MALLNSLTSGVSALDSFTQGLEVIGDNIANVNTTAFKSSTINYTDSFSNTLRTSSSSNGNSSNITSSQLGTGVKVQTVSNDFGQGYIENTGVETDLAIAGDGYFQVVDPVNNNEYATRAGNFRVDDKGNLTTSDGYRVQGLMGGEIEYDVYLDSKDNLVYRVRDDFPTDVDSQTVADLNVSPPELNTTTGTLDLKGTAPAGLKTFELNSLGTPYQLSELEAELKRVDGFDFGGYYKTVESMEDAVNVGTITSEQLNRAIEAENGGVGLSISGKNYKSLTAIRADIDSGKIEQVDADAAIAAVNSGAGIQANFTTLQGIRDALDAGVMSEADINAALTAENLTIDTKTYDGTTGLEWSDLNSLYVINPVTNDTYTLEEINSGAPRSESFSFDTQGNLNMTMSDGNSYTMGKVLLMDFNDPQALVREGDGLYTGFDAAGVVGDFLTNYPGENGNGQILQNSLEQSNVDLTEEFAKMIEAQRSFQAGSRVVTVSDEILSEIVNLKR